MEIQNIELNALHSSKTNPRQIFDKAKMEELVKSVKESGIITPLIVRSIPKGYEVVAGERRLRAAREVGDQPVPCIVRELTDLEAMELQVIENDQRVDVHPLEQSASYIALAKQLKGSTTDLLSEIARRVGKSPAYIAKRMQYVHLIEPIRKLFLAGTLRISHADIIARLTEAQQKEVFKTIKGDQDIDLDWLRREIESSFFLILQNAPFDPADATLTGGDCAKCPKRTGFNKFLFDDIKREDVCTDRACFQNKTNEHMQREVKAHPKAVKLSVPSNYWNPSYGGTQPKYATDWVKAGDKNCDDTKEGIVMERTSENPKPEQNAPLGRVVRICTNAHCKTHHPPKTMEERREERAERDPYHEKQLAEERKRRLELKRRGMVFKELASAPFKLDAKADYRAILDWMLKELSHDHARAICHGMEWEAPKKYGNPDFIGAVRSNLKKLDQRGIHQWLYLALSD